MFIFALDYWWSIDSIHTNEEHHQGRLAFRVHLANIVNMDILQDRLIACSHIANEETDDKVKYFGFGRKLLEFCGVSLAPYLLVLAPDLFTEALESLTLLRTVKLKLL